MDEGHEGEEDVVAKVDDGCEEAEDDEEDQGTPGWTDDGIVRVVVVDDKDADDGCGEGEQTDEACDEEADDEHDVGVRRAGQRVACRLSYRERTAGWKTHVGERAMLEVRYDSGGGGSRR